MSEKILKAWTNLGELDTKTNPVLRDSRGARELTNIGDLAGDGSVESLPGYTKLLPEPILADYTTGTVEVSNGSKQVVGTDTRWLFGPVTELVENGAFAATTGWTLAGGTFTDTAGWDISGGVATRYGAATNMTLTNSFTPVVGQRYELSYSWTRTGGDLTVSCGGYTHTHSTSVSDTETFVASNTNPLVFTAVSIATVGTLDNVSCHVAAQQAFRGDLFIGPDGEYYEITDVTKDVGGEDTLTLTTEYEGDSATGASYSIRHKVWMLAPFKSQVANNGRTVSQSYVSTTDGTFTNTSSDAYGVGIAYTSRAYVAIPGSTAELTINVANPRFGMKFKPTATLTDLPGVSLKLDLNNNSETFRVIIVDDNAGVPGSTVVATTGTLTASVQRAKTGESKYYYDFTTPPTLASGTWYWIVVQALSGTGTVGDLTYGGSVPTKAGVNVGSYIAMYFTGAWTLYGSVSYIPFGFLIYPSAATTYVGAVIDLGGIPTGDSTLTVDLSTQSNDFYTTNGYLVQLNCASGQGNTLTWELNGSTSSDMSSPQQVATGQTGATYTIDSADAYRYYQLTYTLTSGEQASTPLVVGAAISATMSDVVPQDLNLTELVGCGANVYTSISSGASTINTTSQTSVRPASWCTYNNNFFYRNGATLLRAWDGIAVADKTVASMLKVDDSSAGTDPAERAYIVVTHNDKLITAGYVGLPTGTGATLTTGASTTITETVLTCTGKTWTASSSTVVGLTGWKVCPDTSWAPEQWFVVTSSTATTVTSAGSQFMTKGHADLGDNFVIYKFYPKTAWYSTENEPADHPSANFLNFNTADGDMIQAVVSHNGNALFICAEQVWLVRGYGPSTPWQKGMLCKSGGTIAPLSPVSTAYDVFWWAEEGIVRCAGGTSVPETIDGPIRDLTIEALDRTMRHNCVGTVHQGCIYWSFPTTGSNVNNRTVVFDPSTRQWAFYDFGMYCPVSVLDTDGFTYLKFWEPTSGCICKIDPDVYTHGGVVRTFVHTTAFSAVSNPVEMAQYLYLRCVVAAGEEFSATVSAAYDYSSTYTVVGELVPVDSATTGRTTVNATDTIYVCRFGTEVRGTSISVKITGVTSARVKIMQVEIVADPVEYPTLR